MASPKEICPTCGGKEFVTQVRKEHAQKRCLGCGYSTSVHNTTPSFTVLRPLERRPMHRSHPHHYVALMLLFLGLAFLFLVVRFVVA